MDLVTALIGALGVLGCVIFTVFIYVVITLYQLHSKYDHLPGPKRSSFFAGNMEVFMGVRQGGEAFEAPDKATGKLKPLPNERMIALHDTYGETYVLYIFHQAWIVTRDPNVIKSSMVDGDQSVFIKTKKTKAYGIFGARFMADGLATTRDYHGWYMRRKILDPMFHRNQLRHAMDTFNLTGDQFVDKLQGYAETGESFSLLPVLHRSTIDVVMRSMFSMDTDSLTSKFHDKSIAFVNDSFEAVQRASLPFYEWTPLTYPYRRKIKHQIEEFREIGAKIIQERITLVQTETDVPDDILTTIVKNYLEEKGSYTFDIMVDEFVTVVVAGMETTANTLGFCFMELSRRPDLVKRLVAEVDEVVGNKSDISSDDLTKFSFLTMLIKETLRYYPPVAMIARDVTKAVEIEGMRIPEDSSILVNILGSNRNEKYVSEPLKFDPDRFDAKQQNRVPMYANLSFSVGPRNCIGQNFAQMEMKVMLAKFFQRFSLTIDENECYGLGLRATIFPLSLLKCSVSQRV